MIVAIVTSALASSAFFAFIQFLITRYDEKKGKMNELTAKIDTLQSGLADLRSELDEREATDARRRILTASDEIRRGHRHSKEWFDQLNADIDAYNHYCDGHQEFKNNRAVKAIENINNVYLRCLETNDFDD